jgi:hypothetical protein
LAAAVRKRLVAGDCARQQKARMGGTVMLAHHVHASFEFSNIHFEAEQSVGL